MRHGDAHRKLSRSTAHRTALMRNLLTALIRHEQIRTTVVRAKEIRSLAEKLITLSKRAHADTSPTAPARKVHLIRQARLWVADRELLQRLFDDVGPRFASRPGGYTRIVKLARRPGDQAEMAIIELVDKAEKKA